MNSPNMVKETTTRDGTNHFQFRPNHVFGAGAIGDIGGL